VKTKSGNSFALAAVGTLLIALAGCATVEHSTPALSAAIAKRTVDMQVVHEQAVRRYFAAERRRVEDFFHDTWVPLFLRNMVGNTRIVAMLAATPRLDESRRSEIATAIRLYVDDKQADAATEATLKAVESNRSREPNLLRAALKDFVSDAGRADAAATHIASLLGTEEPANLMIEWAKDAEKQIEKKRRELLAPIDEAEQSVLAELAGGYAELHSAQAVLTARLEAAAKVKDEQDQVLEDLGAEKTFANIKHRLTGVSDAVGAALTAADGQLDSAAAEAVLSKTLRDELHKTIAERPSSEHAE
jgi:ribonuclease HII